MNREAQTCLAFDFGAGSGRAVLVTLDDGRLATQELARFPSVERQDADGLHWDAAALMAQVESGLLAAAASGRTISSIGVDSWGVDYGLIGADGGLLSDPFHYRNPRSQRGYAASPFADDDLAAMTDAQVLPINTLFQLIDDTRNRPALLARADRVLMMADLVNHHLTGIARNELTLARTTGLHSWRQAGWSGDILAKAGLALHLFGTILQPGSILGPLRAELAARSGVGPVPVIAVAGHDTASAAYALPLQPAEAFLIAGSWNLTGFETETPPPNAQAAGFGIEGGAAGRALLTRSLAGFVLIRRLQESLSRQGHRQSFAEISASARSALGHGVHAALDTTDPALLSGDFQTAAAAQFARRALPSPSGGHLALALYLGLVAEVANSVARIGQLAGTPLRRLRMGGGGCQDEFFCALLAARLDLPVLAGPVEASATGNGLFQLIGLGRMASITDARKLVETSGTITTHHPDATLQHLLAG